MRIRRLHRWSLTHRGAPALARAPRRPRTAVRRVLACAGGHRLPEPARLADRTVGEAADAVRSAR